jgi:HlyD family secretion protein
MPNPPLLPAEICADTVESLWAPNGLDRPLLYWMVLAACAAGLLATPFLRLDVAISASGMVRPAVERCDLPAAVAGLVAGVLAHDNDRVRAGQPLVVLQSRDIDERLRRNQALQADHEEIMADLRGALAPGRAPDAPPADPPVAFRTVAFQQEYVQFLASLAANRLAASRSRTEADRARTLTSRGITSRRELDDATYEFERLQAEGRLLTQQTFARWAARLREEQTALATLASDQTRLLEERTLYTIRAPAAGTLVGFSGVSPGVFVLAGQSLGTLSPDDSLVVETVIPPRDAGLIRTGQRARIQVDAYPYVRWGTLDGLVTAISGDVTNSSASGGGGGSPFCFKATIRPATTTLRLPNGLCGELRKGLTVQTRFLITRCSLLRFLYDDVRSLFDPAPTSIRAASPLAR